MKLSKKKLIMKMLDKLETHDPSRLQYFTNTIMDEVIPNLEEDQVPETEQHHIGIEVECFGPCGYAELEQLICYYDLEDHVRVGGDASISPEMGTNDFELRILASEDKLTEVLEKCRKLFKAAKLKTNYSCGLHVHLDMRNRDFKKCYGKLLRFQDVLFSLVDKKRWDSDFCKYTNNITIQDPECPRYFAINSESMEDLNTIEIRLHEGTVNINKIEKWVNLLITVINARTVPRFKTKESVLNWKYLKPQLKKYIEKTMKTTWFKEKKRHLAILAERQSEYYW